MIIHKIQCKLRPRGLRSFLDISEKKYLTILDVGCGNRSSIFINSINARFEIHGIDVADYNQTHESMRKYFNYHITKPVDFSYSIKNMNVNFDYIISNHNIEHCNNPLETFDAMIERLTPGGYMFVATPSIKSINFPSREGTLNFYDDITHKHPIDLRKLLALHADKVECIFFDESYRPFFWRIVGFACEFLSRLNSKVMLGTWDYYGFEQIMWLRKIKS
jgi:2-polyprenyl-3-methyl-5-hydroxy-6-metoxy-1,4-benzoquinol methylase